MSGGANTQALLFYLRLITLNLYYSSMSRCQTPPPPFDITFAPNLKRDLCPFKHEIFKNRQMNLSF